MYILPWSWAVNICVPFGVLIVNCISISNISCGFCNGTSVSCLDLGYVQLVCPSVGQLPIVYLWVIFPVGSVMELVYLALILCIGYWCAFLCAKCQLSIVSIMNIFLPFIYLLPWSWIYAIGVPFGVSIVKSIYTTVTA